MIGDKTSQNKIKITEGLNQREEMKNKHLTPLFMEALIKSQNKSKETLLMK